MFTKTKKINLVVKPACDLTYGDRLLIDGVVVSILATTIVGDEIDLYFTAVGTTDFVVETLRVCDKNLHLLLHI